MKTNLIIGTRQSLLALWQSNHIADLLRRQYPECTVTLKKIITKEDLSLMYRWRNRRQGTFYQGTGNCSSRR